MNAQCMAHYLANRYPEKLIILYECTHEGKKHKHHADYSKPHEVELLCSECHSKKERKPYKPYKRREVTELALSTRFENIIKSSRKDLLDAGYNASRISMWAHGNRHPSYEVAQDLARILKIPLDSIPWVRWQRNQ